MKIWNKTKIQNRLQIIDDCRFQWSCVITTDNLMELVLFCLCQTSHPILSFMPPTVSLILFPFRAPQPFRCYQYFKPLILIMWAHFFLVELPHSTLVTSTIQYIFSESNIMLSHPSPVQKYLLAFHSLASVQATAPCDRLKVAMCSFSSP